MPEPVLPALPTAYCSLWHCLTMLGSSTGPDCRAVAMDSICAAAMRLESLIETSPRHVVTVGSVCHQVSSIKKISGGRSVGIVDNSPRMVYLKMKDDSQQVWT
jgi:hypothetical protein